MEFSPLPNTGTNTFEWFFFRNTNKKCICQKRQTGVGCCLTPRDPLTRLSISTNMHSSLTVNCEGQEKGGPNNKQTLKSCRTKIIRSDRPFNYPSNINISYTQIKCNALNLDLLLTCSMKFKLKYIFQHFSIFRRQWWRQIWKLKNIWHSLIY